MSRFRILMLHISPDAVIYFMLETKSLPTDGELARKRKRGRKIKREIDRTRIVERCGALLRLEHRSTIGFVYDRLKMLAR